MSTATGFAAYDETIGQFVTGVHEKESAAKEAAANVPKGHKVTVKKV